MRYSNQSMIKVSEAILQQITTERLKEGRLAAAVAGRPKGKFQTSSKLTPVSAKDEF